MLCIVFNFEYFNFVSEFILKIKNYEKDTINISIGYNNNNS
jgi:hypothetical protein